MECIVSPCILSELNSTDKKIIEKFTGSQIEFFFCRTLKMKMTWLVRRGNPKLCRVTVKMRVTRVKIQKGMRKMAVVMMVVVGMSQKLEGVEVTVNKSKNKSITYEFKFAIFFIC